MIFIRGCHSTPLSGTPWTVYKAAHVISQGKIPWNTPPWSRIEPGPWGGQTVSYPSELSWPLGTIHQIAETVTKYMQSSLKLLTLGANQTNNDTNRAKNRALLNHIRLFTWADSNCLAQKWDNWERSTARYLGKARKILSSNPSHNERPLGK